MANFKKKDLLLGAVILFIFFLFFLPHNRIDITVSIYDATHMEKYIPNALLKKEEKEKETELKKPAKK